MTAPTVLTISLDWTPYLSRRTGYNPETDEEYSEQTSFEDLIIEHAARIVASGALASQRDLKREVAAKANAAIDVLIAERVTAEVHAFFTEPRTPTDTWGNPKGEPTTFGENVAAKVEAILTKTHGADLYDRKAISGTVIDRAIHAEVTETVKKAVKAAVDAQRDAVVAKVAASSAEVLTEGLRRAVAS